MLWACTGQSLGWLWVSSSLAEVLMLPAVPASCVHWVTPACRCCAPAGRLHESPTWCLLHLKY